MASCRGMVVVSGVTYRINESRGGYEVIRLMDDRLLGCFGDVAAFDAVHGASPETIAAVARVALRAGKLRWVRAVGAARPPVRALLRHALRDLTNGFWATVERCGWLFRVREPVAARATALGLHPVRVSGRRP